MTKKVGFRYPPDNKKLTYARVETDADGWVDINDYLPADYDLTFVKLDNRSGTFSAWSTGTNWDGEKLSPDDTIVYWKRQFPAWGDYG